MRVEEKKCRCSGVCKILETVGVVGSVKYQGLRDGLFDEERFREMGLNLQCQKKDKLGDIIPRVDW